MVGLSKYRVKCDQICALVKYSNGSTLWNKFDNLEVLKALQNSGKLEIIELCPLVDDYLTKKEEIE